MNEYRIGRALQLTGLENAKNKVTIGFKADANTKIQLAREASDNGLTLSEYVDTILSLRHEGHPKTEIKEVIMPDQKTLADLANTQKMYQNALLKVKFYENDFLQSAYERYKGQTVTIEIDGLKQEILIDSLQATYTALMSTIKLK